jgi:hypothetical protein
MQFQERNGYNVGYGPQGPVMQHRQVWEQANGPIPAGQQVDHIDGNSMNNDLSNLQLMSQQEHLFGKHASNLFTSGSPSTDDNNPEAQAPDKDMILKRALQDIDRANSYFRDYIEQDLIERYQVYYASKERYKQLYPKTSEQNSTRTFDLWSTCEWMMPNLLGAFFGSDRIISINGTNGEDSQKAEQIMKLIQWQLTVKNQGYRIFKGWFGDALVTNMGVLKCYWKREQKQVPHQEVLNEQQLIGLMQNTNNQIISSEPVPDINAALGMAPPTSNVTWVETITTVNQPVIELIKPSDLRFVPDGRTLGECSMVAHRKLVTIDYLRREAKRGVFDPAVVEDIARTATNYQSTSQLEIVLNNAAREATQFSDEELSRKRVVLYECYAKMDINGDGLLEDVIVNVCNKQLLRVVENPWGRAPIFELIPFWDNYQVWSKVGLAELVADIQDSHTALLRQMIYGLGVSNQVHGVVDTSMIEVQDLIDGAQYIRSKGPVGPAAFQQLQLGGLNPQNFQMFEYIRTQLEQWTPMTRYNQGMDSQSLNKTATGINMIMDASQSRQEEISRNFAETGISELYRFLIQLNQHYVDQEQIIRLHNEQILFTPDDLNGDYDLSVDSSSGTASKNEKMQALMAYMREMLPAAVQMGVAGPDQFVIAGLKLLKLGGIEDAEKFLIPPDPMQQAAMMQQMQMAQMISQGGLPGVPNEVPGGAVSGRPVPEGTERPAQSNSP